MAMWSEPAQDVPRQPAPRRTWAQRLLLFLGVLSTMSTLVAAAGVAWGLQRYQSISFVEVPNVEQAVPGEPSNWLLVGSDSREGIDPNDPNAGVFVGEPVDGKRTDTIIIARVDPATRTVDLLSVPRDLWVPIAGTGSNGRINSAFNGDGGEERLVSTVEGVLGIEINNYAEVNFVGFQAVIDALGGVPIWFDTPVRDPKSGLDIGAAGCHTLDGYQALAFARSRSLEYHDGDRWRTDPTGDLGRTARQQFLLGRLASTASAQVDLTSFGTIDEILRVGGQNLLIDDGAGANDLLDLARTFAGVGGEGIRRHSLPVEGFRTSGGAAVLRLLGDQAQPTLDVFRGVVPVDPLAPPSPEAAPANSVTIAEVQNGARVAGLAGATADELRAAGFAVTGVADAPNSVEQTIVRYPAGMESQATAVGTALTAPPLYERDDTITGIVLVLGPDYVGLGPAAAPAAPEATQPEPVPTEPAPATEPAALEGENEVGVVPGPGPPGTPCA